MAHPSEPTYELQDTTEFQDVSLQDEKRTPKKAGFSVDRRVWIALVGVVGVMAIAGVAIGATVGSAGVDDALTYDQVADERAQEKLRDEVAHSLVKMAHEIHQSHKEVEEEMIKPEALKHHKSLFSDVGVNKGRTHPEIPKKKINKRLPTWTNADDELICSTPECAMTANTLIQSLNTSVDPCENFYEFSCGGWVAAHPIDNGSQGTFYEADDLLQLRLRTILDSDPDVTDPIPLFDMRTFYDACLDTVAMDVMGLDPLIDELNKLGGWPMTMDTWDNSLYTIEEGVAGVQKLQIGPLISIGDDSDYLNTSIKILYITEGSTGMSLSNLLDTNSSTAYKNYIGDSAKLVRDAIGSNQTNASIDAEVEEMVNFETTLAQLMRDHVFHNFSNDLEKMTVAELQTSFDSLAPNQFNWLNYLRILFSGSGVDIQETEPVYVVIGSYMPELAVLLNNTDERVVVNYLGWFWTMVSSPETTFAMRELSETFDQEVYGRNPSSDRYQHCVDQVNYNLGFATTRAYVDDYFSREAKNETQQLVVEIQKAFRLLIDEADWMLEEDKVVAKEKLDFIEQNTAYPDWILDDTSLEAAYGGLVVLELDHYGNLMRLADFIRYADLSTFRDDPMTAFAGMPPTVVNAYYSVFANSINILVGILQPPFYQHNSSYAVNYGAIGLVIGHEFTHGFDNNGRRFDKDGNYHLWWTAETTENFVNESQCFVDQYNEFSPPELVGTPYEGQTVDGQQTLGENIADNGGIREAFRAYQSYVSRFGVEPRLPGLDEYTPDQLFFMGFANVWCEHKTTSSILNQLAFDPHSPGRFRVDGSVSNDVDFRNTWGCNVADEMDRGDESCVLW